MNKEEEEEVKVKIQYDERPDEVAENILHAVQRVAPEIKFERLDGGDGFEEYKITKVK